jgi:hypothetical protein
MKHRDTLRRIVDTAKEEVSIFLSITPAYCSAE